MNSPELISEVPPSPLPWLYTMLRPPVPGEGSVENIQSSSPPRLRISGWRMSVRARVSSPASISKILAEGLYSWSLLATTQPAWPPPAIM